MPMNEDAKDELFSGPGREGEPFRFDSAVVRVFPDMVGRSVPCYDQLVGLSGLLGRRFVSPGTNVYDLGCSLGAVTCSLLEHVPDISCRLVAVDNSSAMIETLTARLQGMGLGGRVTPVCAEAESIPIENASLVVLNLTLQFIPPEQRLPLLSRIRRSLVPGGALILSEKVRATDPDEDRLLTALHEDFKRANGYSELEIGRKRAALEQVLIPEEPELHLKRLREAGFPHYARWFQCLSFVSFVAWT
jgi:tRNA (cmo5U34)-methyltransferase